MRNWQCKKCGLLLTSDHMPNESGCSEGGFFKLHSWIDYGEVGVNNYQCKHCGLMLKSKYEPATENCPNNKGLFGGHKWRKL